MTKPVTLSNAAYEALLRLKDKETSFSDVVLKLVDKYNRKNDFKKFAGSLKAKSEDYESFKKQIERDREQNTEKL
ncbi:MAG: antitoxin VapB family protein [Thermoplasmataceae archaeon]|jgi:predicted CopG family antitoxin